MTKGFRFLHALLLVPITFLCASSLALAANPSPLSGFSLTMTPDATSYTASQVPIITFTISNNSSVSRSIPLFGVAHLDFPLVVTNAAGNVVAPALPPKYLVSSGRNAVFAPGEVRKMKLKFDDYGYTLSPGSYKVTLALAPTVSFQLTITS